MGTADGGELQAGFRRERPSGSRSLQEPGRCGQHTFRADEVHQRGHRRRKVRQGYHRRCQGYRRQDWNCRTRCCRSDLAECNDWCGVEQDLPLFAAFTNNFKSEINLLNKIQEYCYDNMNFLKTFNKIILLLYKIDILSEDAILKWYKEAHSQRGWSVFMDQMKKFIEWLEQAEEESDEEEDDED